MNDATRTVLIVDDEPDIRELLEITLGRMNLATFAAENVAQAKQLRCAGAEQRMTAPFSDFQRPIPPEASRT